MDKKLRSGLLIIVDGFGLAAESRYNAVSLAKMPTWKKTWENFPHTELIAAGEAVGLKEGVAGNSEVGHTTIGAGRRIDQHLVRIQKALESEDFKENPVWKALITLNKEKPKNTLHLIGLVSEGFVHSSLKQLQYLLKHLKEAGVKKVALHAILDGRDFIPTGGLSAVKKVEGWLKEYEFSPIQSLIGRFYAMDRDKHWDRIEEAFRLWVSPKKAEEFSSASQQVEKVYAQGTSDEFFPASKNRSFSGIKDGDSILFFNYRADRVRQMATAFVASEFGHFTREGLPILSSTITLTDYGLPTQVPILFPKEKIQDTLGEIMSMNGKQLRIAETEKYAHVTYFFSGGREETFANEKRILVPSNRTVRSYDESPQMSAAQITESALDYLEKEKPVLTVLNYANADMLAHTGNLTATVQGLETVDKNLKQLLSWVEKNKAFALITSDHGNAEKMLSDEGGPLPCHTLSSVPLVLVDSQRQEQGLKMGTLADIAPTFLALQGLSKPEKMTGSSLV